MTKRNMTRGLQMLLCVTVLTLGAAGCGDKKAGKPKGSGTPDVLTPVANDPAIGSPFDATPDADGKNVYFTAVGPNGPGVFKVSVTGGAIQTLAEGTPFVSPFSIALSGDGSQLFIADAGAEGLTEDDDDGGRLFMVPIGGGVPAELAGATGRSPRSVAVIGDDIWFTGIDIDGVAAVFRGDAGGAVTAFAKGAPLGDPSGIAVPRLQDAVYVIDTVVGADNQATVVKIDGATAEMTTLVSGFRVGFPAGAALSNDESALLVSGYSADGDTDAVLRVELATNEVTYMTTGIDTFAEPAGLHRAANAEVYAWADSQANATGTVFVLTESANSN